MEEELKSAVTEVDLLGMLCMLCFSCSGGLSAFFSCGAGTRALFVLTLEDTEGLDDVTGCIFAAVTGATIVSAGTGEL